MAKEPTVKEKLVQLYTLQTIDSKLDEIKVMKGELPMEVSDLEDELVGLNTRQNKLKTGISEIEETISKHTANIKESETLIEKYKKQLDNVKNNREFDALNKELEMQSLEIQLSEKRIREATTELEEKKEMLEKVVLKTDLRADALDTKKEELQTILTKTEKDENKLLKESAKARKDIEERYLKSYDKIRKNYRNGLAVAILERESCGGCYNKIPPQLQIEIANMKNVFPCEHCGRILIDEAIADHVKK